MPNDPRLGQYRAMFAGRVGLFAVHADERSGDRRGFGGYSRIVGSEVAFDTVRKDPAHAFDAESYLRIRLLDFVVGDWDRHAGQWRWGRELAEGRTIWRPIPEDRDWAFGRIDGFTAAVARVVYPRYVGFSDELPPVMLLARSGREVDRTVLSQLERDDFAAAARDVEAALSDSAIEAAVAHLPAPYVPLEHDRLVGGIRARRQALARYTEQYYRYLAREVEVHAYAGSRDVAEFTRLTEARARLTVRSGVREGREGRVTFERVIDGRDTRRVRLYVDEREDQVRGDDDLPFDLEIVDERRE
jgi:hypothetical protein